MTVATMELPMTLKDADAAIQDWQDKLQDAQANLANHERQLGEIALAQGVDNATQAITRLQIKVRMAETGLVAAQQQREAVRRREQAERVTNLRAEAAELEAQVEDAATFLDEWGPKVANARNQIEHLSRRASSMRLQADEIEWKLRKGQTNG